MRVPHGTVGFTRYCTDRDRRKWPYASLLSDQHGHLIFQAAHGTELDLKMSVRAYGKRIREAKPNRGGQIPTTIDVSGVARSTWQGWLQ